MDFFVPFYHTQKVSPLDLIKIFRSTFELHHSELNCYINTSTPVHIITAHLKMSFNTSTGSSLDCNDAAHNVGSRSNGRIHVNGDSHDVSNMPLEVQPNHLDGPSSCSESDKLEPIAIIGLSLRLPQDATSPEAFWKMLMEKRSAMTDVPSDRFNVEAFHQPTQHESGVVRSLCSTSKCFGESR